MRITCYLGRFQPFHRGHLRCVLEALKVSDKVVICVAYAKTSSKVKNHFSYADRKRIIEYGLAGVGVLDKCEFIPILHLEDTEDIKERAAIFYDYFTRYIKQDSFNYLKTPDHDIRAWFEPSILNKITTTLVSREDMDISVTQVRELILKQDIDGLYATTFKIVVDNLDYYRGIIMNSK